MSFTTAIPHDTRPLLFSGAGAARYLGVSSATISRWADAGQIASERTPCGQLRFSRAQLDSFIASAHQRRRSAA